jgi:hypothetical protein
VRLQGELGEYTPRAFRWIAVRNTKRESDLVNLVIRLECTSLFQSPLEVAQYHVSSSSLEQFL